MKMIMLLITLIGFQLKAQESTTTVVFEPIKKIELVKQEKLYIESRDPICICGGEIEVYIEDEGPRLIIAMPQYSFIQVSGCDLPKSLQREF